MIIAFANHKGGTGKTTSVINIGTALSNAGKKILVVDLDPQGNLSYSLGLDKQDYNVADLMLGRQTFEEIACEANNLHVLPADGSLYRQMEYIGLRTDKNTLLKTALKKVEDHYDFILIDCAPSLSLYTTNAFNAADGVIIPLVFEILSIQGLDQILEEIKRIRELSNPALRVIGVLGVIVNESRKLSEEVLEYIRDNFKVSVFNNHIRNNVKAAEAPSFASSVIDYAPNSTSAKDYINVSNELLTILKQETINH
jgi:chromosome partitioning protein